MAARQGMKHMRNNAAGEHQQHLSKRKRRDSSISPQKETTTGDTISPLASTGPSERLTLFTLLEQYHLIHDEIVSMLSPLDFGRLCESFPVFSKLLVSRRLDVHKKLGRFFADPRTLREVMAKSAALIAGKFVLQLVEGKRGKGWLKNPLEFFVMTGQNETLLKHHLASEQYSCVTKDISSPQVRQRQKIIETRTYERTTSQFGKTVIIVHITEEHPLFSIVTSAHFTTDLNIMSWNKAYAPFFHETFVQHKMYLLGGLTNASGAVSGTYDELGWSTTDMVIMSDESEVPAFQDLMTGHTFPATNLLGYSHSVVNVSSVTFDDMEVPDAVPDSVLESCRFGFEQRYRSSGKCMEANIAAFNHPLLKYSYTRLPHSDWDFVVSRLEALLPFELAKLDLAIRPGNVLKELIDGDLVMSSPLTAWKWTPTTMPEGWNFMDHLVRGWLMMAYQIRISALDQNQ